MMTMHEVMENTEATPVDQEVNSHTLIGFGFIACILAAIWLIRRLRA